MCLQGKGAVIPRTTQRTEAFFQKILGIVEMEIQQKTFDRTFPCVYFLPGKGSFLSQCLQNSTITISCFWNKQLIRPHIVRAGMKSIHIPSLFCSYHLPSKQELGRREGLRLSNFLKHQKAETHCKLTSQRDRSSRSRLKLSCGNFHVMRRKCSEELEGMRVLTRGVFANP